MIIKQVGFKKLPKVLIVDDEPNIIAILGNILGGDFKKQVSTSGIRALQILEESDDLPDVILLDIIMKETDGYQIAARIRNNIRLKDIPIIMISGLTDGESIRKAIDAGCTDYIKKPFEKQEVLSRVSMHIAKYHKMVEMQNDNLNMSIAINKKTQEILDSQMATILALAKLAERRDDITGGHLVRVQSYSRLILEKLIHTDEYKNIINHEYIDLVVNASMLHDIGKVAIEDSILLKQGKLTDLEFDRMKLHTVIGAQTLEEVDHLYHGNKFIEVGIEIAKHHHEKWNGQGYPDKLSKEDIPLSARVVAIADIYDALRSERTYKKGFSHEKACSILKEISGVDLDPFIVDIFLEYENEIADVFDKMI